MDCEAEFWSGGWGDVLRGVLCYTVCERGWGWDGLEW